MSTTTTAINTAIRHLGGDMRSSALSCIQDAKRCLEADEENLAALWALRSLSYSVGIFSPAYVAVKASIEVAS